MHAIYDSCPSSGRSLTYDTCIACKTIQCLNLQICSHALLSLSNTSTSVVLPSVNYCYPVKFCLGWVYKYSQSPHSLSHSIVLALENSLPDESPSTMSIPKTISLIYKILLLQKLVVIPHVPCLNKCNLLENNINHIMRFYLRV